MRESQIERQFDEIFEIIENLEEGGTSEGESADLEETLENYSPSSFGTDNTIPEAIEGIEAETADNAQEISTLKMQLGKVRSRVQDLEEEFEERTDEFREAIENLQEEEEE